MSHVKVEIGAAFDTGLREHNEDSFLAKSPVFLVADGMGGHQKGDVASDVVIQAFKPLAKQDFVTGDQLDDVIRDAAEKVSALGDPQDPFAPGSTLSGLVFSLLGDLPCARVFNIGDSRTYHLSGTSFTLATKDHSEVQEMVDAGQITPAEARTAVNRNVITRALGGSAGADVGADVALLPLRTGDRFVVATDGLSSEVPDAVISNICRHTTDPQETADILVQRALGAGGRDNVTVVVVDILAVDPQWDDSDVNGETNSVGRRASEDTIPRKKN